MSLIIGPVAGVVAATPEPGLPPIEFVGAISGRSLTTLPVGSQVGDIAIWTFGVDNVSGTVHSKTQLGTTHGDLFGGSWAAYCFATILTASDIASPPTQADTSSNNEVTVCAVYRGALGFSLLSERPTPNQTQSFSLGDARHIVMAATGSNAITWDGGGFAAQRQIRSGSFFTAIIGDGPADAYSGGAVGVVDGGSTAGAAWVIGLT